MKVALVGCGRVGMTIGYFLKKRNHLYGVFDKNRKRLNQALKLLKIKNNPAYADLIENSEVILFATPDDEILNAYKKAKQYIKSKKYVFHFSGLLTAEVFPDDKLVFRASVHPFATFPRIIIPPPQTRFFLFFQGDKECLKVALSIFPRKHFFIHRIAGDKKGLYHLSGVFSSNFVVGLIEGINMIIKKMGWNEKNLKNFILPLIRETINNVEKYGWRNALSGPVVRGDIETVKKHLKILKNDSKLQDVYRSISSLITKYAPPKSREELEKILKMN
ncbi:MAG: DUF2520 domain-containing protein [candidate division WOR-3 bacterium]|nr:DUF2520 domain-containing protein [candidate division WOR-3 bacterium]